jgi:hypothetical protein
METRELENCGGILLDLIYYEFYRGHLSPEMEFLFCEHLAECAACRERVLATHEFVTDAFAPVRNFG